MRRLRGVGRFLQQAFCLIDPQTVHQLGKILPHLFVDVFRDQPGSHARIPRQFPQRVGRLQEAFLRVQAMNNMSATLRHHVGRDNTSVALVRRSIVRYNLLVCHDTICFEDYFDYRKFGHNRPELPT